MTKFFSFKKTVIIIFLFVFSILGLCMDKFLILWGLLEIYGIFYLLFIFLKKTTKCQENKIYFGIMGLLSSVMLILAFFLDLKFLAVMALLVKMGSFPFSEWVVKFCSSLSPGSSFLFFTLNKVLPLMILSEFLKFKLMFSLIMVLLNWLICFPNMMKSIQLMQVISWSSMVSNGYFLLMASMDLSGVLLMALLVYSIILGMIFFSMKDSYFYKGSFFVIVLLFGVPPFSIFLFKVSFFMALLPLFSLFWVYMFTMIFFFLGIGYFSFFVKESFNMSSNLEYTAFFPSDSKLWWVLWISMIIFSLWVMFLWC